MSQPFFICFVIYCMLLCFLIFRRKRKQGKKGIGLRTAILVVGINGLFVISSSINFNSIATIVSGNIHTAVVTGINTQKTASNNRSNNRGETSKRRRSSRQTIYVYAPIFTFQTEEGFMLEKTLNIYTSDKPVIGEKAKIHYSVYTDQVFQKTGLGYVLLGCGTVISIFLLLFAVALLLYAVRGTIPDRLAPLCRWTQKYQLCLLCIILTCGMSVTLAYMVIQRLFFDWRMDIPILVVGLMIFFVLVTSIIAVALFRWLIKKSRRYIA